MGFAPARELRGVVEGLGVRSEIAVPLEVDGARRGVLSAQSTRPGYFSDADMRFLVAVSSWVGAAVHRAELVEELSRRAVERGRGAGAEELMTVLAHDLGNYLQPLNGRLHLLIDSARKDGRADDIRHIEAAQRVGRRLLRLTRDLLDVARLERGLFAVTPVPFDLVALARDAAVALSTTSNEVRLTGAEELTVHGDPDRIRQLLDNLIANAVKHSPAGMPVVVEIAMQPAVGSLLAAVDVIDEGPGIADDVMPRLFERFEAAGRSAGLGLGLYLASRIAESHRGRVTVEPSSGKGTRFRFVMPVDERSPVATPPRA